MRSRVADTGHRYHYSKPRRSAIVGVALLASVAIPLVRPDARESGRTPFASHGTHLSRNRVLYLYMELPQRHANLLNTSPQRRRDPAIRRKMSGPAMRAFFRIADTWK